MTTEPGKLYQKGVRKMDTIPNMVEAEAIVCLAPAVPVPNGQLETVAEHLQELLDETPELLELTQGAAVGANFKEGRVEIDVCLEGASAMDLQQQMLTLLLALDKHLNFAPTLPLQPMPRKKPKTAPGHGEQVMLRGTSLVYA